MATRGDSPRAPDGIVIQSDRAEVVVNERGIPIAAVYAGRVRIQRPDGSVIKAAQLEMGYDSAGGIVTIKSPQIECINPRD